MRSNEGKGILEVLGDDSRILVEPGSKEALAEAMEEMMDERVRSEYGKKAKEVAKRFFIDKTAEQYNKLYQELLKHRNNKSQTITY